MNKYGFSTEKIKAFNAQLMKHIITILPGRVRLPTAFGSPYHSRMMQSITLSVSADHMTQ